MNYSDIFQSLLNQIAHEDYLLVSRTNWLLWTQVSLLLGYVFIDKAKLPSDLPFGFHRFIGAAGIISSTFIYSSILACLSVFVQLRLRVFSLIQQHPELPMRPLPRFGLGPGLLCPVLLSLGALFIWSRLTFRNLWAAPLMAGSGAFFAVYAVGAAQNPPPGSSSAFWIGAAIPVALCCLLSAVALGLASIKRSH